MINCSVIVLAWQDYEMTALCVESMGPRAEVIIVDNGSDEMYSEQLRQLSDRAENRKFVRCSRNLGFAGGMNAGLLHASRDVVIFSNNDVIASEQVLLRLVDECLEPGVGAAFPFIGSSDQDSTAPAGRFLTLGRALGMALGLNFIPGLRVGLEAAPADADWISGPFVAMRRLTALSIGGVPHLSFFYSEDYRMCWTLRQEGLSLRVVRGAVISHIDDASSRKVWSTDEVAGRQTYELVRAAVDHQGGIVKKYLLSFLFVFGCWWRNAIRPSPKRAAVLRGAIEARYRSGRSNVR